MTEVGSSLPGYQYQELEQFILGPDQLSDNGSQDLLQEVRQWEQILSDHVQDPSSHLFGSLKELQERFPMFPDRIQKRLLHCPAYTRNRSFKSL